MTPREADVIKAQAMARDRHTLFEISQALGRSKEWLREYAGLTESEGPSWNDPANEVGICRGGHRARAGLIDGQGWCDECDPADPTTWGER